MTDNLPSAMDEDAFMAAFATLFEHSPWVAARVFSNGVSPEDDNVDALHRRLADTMLAAKEDEQLALLRAHPELAPKAESVAHLAKASQSEQQGAGLTSLDDDLKARFDKLNRTYRG